MRLMPKLVQGEHALQELALPLSPMACKLSSAAQQCQGVMRILIACHERVVA